MKPDRTASTRAALIEIMAAHSLTRADVARLLGLPVKRYSHRSVDNWLGGVCDMPAMKLELLELKLATRPAALADA